MRQGIRGLFAGHGLESAAPWLVDCGHPNATGPAMLAEYYFRVDVLDCPSCQGRMKLLAIVTRPENIARYLTAIGEATDLPARSPSRGPPYWKTSRSPASGALV